ncbi:MAG: hypothetical protein Q9M50_06445 [Methylococcales bacterium]|nr:hypothetical protein [Methylococcales bacterium]
MFAPIAALLITVWFYKTAKSSGQKPIAWATAGIVVYFISALFWSYFINPSIKDSALHNQSPLLIFISRYAYIVFALLCATGFKYLMSKKSD